MSQHPTDALLEDILGPLMTKRLEDRGREVRQYYLGLDDTNLRLFDELLLLCAELIASIGKPKQGLCQNSLCRVISRKLLPFLQPALLEAYA